VVVLSQDLLDLDRCSCNIFVHEAGFTDDAASGGSSFVRPKPRVAGRFL